MKEISRNTWAILALFQLAGACIIFGFKRAKGIATGSGMIDSVIFVGQFILYRMHIRRTEVEDDYRVQINNSNIQNADSGVGDKLIEARKGKE